MRPLRSSPFGGGPKRAYKRVRRLGLGALSNNHASPDAVDNDDANVRKVAMQAAVASLARRATAVLTAQTDPEVLDLRGFAIELNDSLMAELALQLRSNLSARQPSDISPVFSTLVLCACESFSAVGIRALALALGDRVRCLDWNGTRVKLDCLQVLTTALSGLETANFSGCTTLTSEAMRELAACAHTSLTGLNLSTCPALNDDALGWLAGALGAPGGRAPCRRLISLDLSFSTTLSDRGLALLGAGCRALQFVNLEGLDRVTDAGVLNLARGCRLLRVLSVRRCLRLTDMTLVHLGTHAHQLRSLNVAACTTLTTNGVLAMLPGTTLLQSLDLEGCALMDERVLAALATSCSSLQRLNVGGCPDVTDNGLATLAEYLPFVQLASEFRGLGPRQDAVARKFALQQQTIAHSAALRIQAAFRGHMGRLRAASWRVEMIHVPARRVIRRAYVSWRLRRSVKERASRRQLERCSAVSIQALARGVQCRSLLTEQLREQARLKEWAVLAVKVQAAYRGHYGRTKTHAHVTHSLARARRERELLARDRAACQLQRAYRARFHRSRLDDVIAINARRRREIHDAATVVQRLFRSRAARRAYRILLEAVEQQQVVVRRLVHFATKMQANWRGHHARVQLANVRVAAASRDQCRHAAASRITAGARGFFARQLVRAKRVEFATATRAARAVQRRWRIYRTPNAERIAYDQMLQRMADHVASEGSAAKAQQATLLRRARELAEQDSASEPESDDDWGEHWDESGEQFWFSPSRAQRVYMRPNENAPARALLGMQCRVYWPLEDSWFPGTITRYHRGKDKHRIEYDDGDHEWLRLGHGDGNRLQLFNGFCWCMTGMWEPAVRTLRAAIFVGLRVQQYDHRYLGWRNGTIRAYSEARDMFLLAYDGEIAASDEWVDLFRAENHVQVQEERSKQWLSLSGYVFGAARGRPLDWIQRRGKQPEGEWFYCVADYLDYVEEQAVLSEGNDQVEVDAAHTDIGESTSNDQKEANDEADAADSDSDDTDGDSEASSNDEDDEEDDGDLDSGSEVEVDDDG